MSDVLEERWDDVGRPFEISLTKKLMPHRLRVHAINEYTFRLALLVEKKSPQFLSLELHGDMNRFLRAWSNGGWMEVDTHREEDLFFALRYLHGPDKQLIVWRVDHRNNVPYDTFTLFKGSLEEMRKFYARVE